MITVSKATDEDLASFYLNIRPMDEQEVLVVSGKPIEAQLADLYARQPEVIKCDGHILGIGGYYRYPLDWGMMSQGVVGWMLLTNAVERHKLEFLRWSKRYVDDLLKTYPYIMNSVYKENKLHVAYLKFLGATFRQDPFRSDILNFTIERR